MLFDNSTIGQMVRDQLGRSAKSALKVLDVLAAHDQGQGLEMIHDKLAIETGLGRNTVRRALDNLVSLDLIERQHRQVNHQQVSNSYKVAIAALNGCPFHDGYLPELGNGQASRNGQASLPGTMRLAHIGTGEGDNQVGVAGYLKEVSDSPHQRPATRSAQAGFGQGRKHSRLGIFQAHANLARIDEVLDHLQARIEDALETTVSDKRRSTWCKAAELMLTHDLVPVEGVLAVIDECYDEGLLGIDHVTGMRVTSLSHVRRHWKAAVA